MTTTSWAGSALLLLIGIGFWATALVRWLHRSEGQPHERGDRPDGHRVTSAVVIVVDAVVGAVALTDAALSVADFSQRVVLWWCGSVALAFALGLLVVHHRQSSARNDEEGSSVPSSRG